jgi:hypothetical protein
MRIEFVPHKIKAAKAYIANLYEDEYGTKKKKQIDNKNNNPSFLERVKRLFYR